MNPFISIPLIGPLFGFFIVFLIPPLLIGGYALLLFAVINRIPRRSLRLLVAVILAIILSRVNYSFENYLRGILTTGGFISPDSSSFFITSSISLTIMAFGAIFAWHLMAVHLRPKYPPLLFFACFVISFLSAFLMGFAALFGPAATASHIPGLDVQTADTIFQMFRFFEMVLFGLVVLGLYKFLQELVLKMAHLEHKYLAYPAVAVIAFFLFIPFFIGCCALSLTLLYGEIHPVIARKMMVIEIPVILALTGFWLTKVSMVLSQENAGLVDCALLAFAVTMPLFLFEPHFDRIAVNGVWIVSYTIITVGITDYFAKILPATLLSPGNFSLFALFAIAIVAACTVQGLMNRFLGANEIQEYGMGK